MYNFFDQAGLERARIQTILSDTLHGLDDGELYLEWCASESFVLDDGRLKNATSDISKGFGMRGVLGEATSYAHSNEISEAAMKRAAQTVKAVNYGQDAASAETIASAGTNHKLYTNDNPLEHAESKEKIAVLRAIDSYVRAKDNRVRQVSASLSGEVQHISILRADGQMLSDIRPLVRLNVSVVVEKDGKLETGSSGAGGRVLYADYLNEHNWQRQADEALRQALVNLEAVPAPAGEMPVVLGPGWCGVLLHEAVGHGLEGDFNRKGTSTFSGRVGEQVTSKGVTIVDNGTMPDRRGSLNIDDEGTASSENILIEDGILKGYMQDRLNARLMGVAATGNGRRESYAHQPMPRMTNTYMQAGEHDQEEMIQSVKRGIFATHFSGGQVDITSGDFVFNASEAYLIEDGKITTPVKGATLIGNGPVAMQKVRMIGNDMALDDGIGTCGKAGQSVPVGVGQPSLLIDPITVGGTAA